jgi:hypothetical protein
MEKRQQIQLGKKYNLLIPTQLSHIGSGYRKYYTCKCDCGNTKVIQGSLLTSGNTKSCGCYGRKVASLLTKLPNNGGVINQILLGYKRHAKDRKLEFILTKEEFTTLINNPCHYCGISSSNTKVTKNCKEGFSYNGIDRVNNIVGYHFTNCVSCCATCNRAKMSMSKEEFLKWISKVFNHIIKPNAKE